MKYDLLFISLLLVSACSSPKSASPDTTLAVALKSITDPQPARADAMAEPELAPTPEAPPTPPVPPTTGRKIIRNATIEFKVTDFRASAKRITALAGMFGGLISEEQESRANDVLRSQMTIRVPAARLDTFVDTLLHESVYTSSKTITAEDVTKRFVDTEARIRSQKATEERYRQLLKQARSVKEILEVDEQLRAIREEVELRESELRELKGDVAMSTIHLTFYQDTDATSAPESPFIARLWANLKGGFGLIGGFFLGLAYLLPLLAVLGGLGWAATRWLHNRRSKA